MDFIQAYITKMFNLNYIFSQVVWKSGSTFKDVVDKYKKFVRTYGKAVIVFDGYCNDPSIKDHEHLRRSLKSSGCPDIKVHPETKVSVDQHRFFANDSNKVKLISLISEALIADGCTVKQAANDADTMIVKGI